MRVFTTRMRSVKLPATAAVPALRVFQRSVSSAPACTGPASSASASISRSGAENTVTVALLLVSAVPPPLTSTTWPPLSTVTSKLNCPVDESPAGHSKLVLRSTPLPAASAAPPEDSVTLPPTCPGARLHTSSVSCQPPPASRSPSFTVRQPTLTVEPLAHPDAGVTASSVGRRSA